MPPLPDIRGRALGQPPEEVQHPHEPHQRLLQQDRGDLRSSQAGIGLLRRSRTQILLFYFFAHTVCVPISN